MSCKVLESHDQLGLQGELTIETTAMVWPDLLNRVRNRKGEAILDFATVTTVDTAGLQVLLMLRRLALAYGSTFMVCNPPPAVRESLMMYGLGGCIGNRGHGLEAGA